MVNDSENRRILRNLLNGRVLRKMIMCIVIYLKLRNGYKVRNSRERTSYTNLRELFLNALKPHVVDISKYSLHSLRSGGATAAANSNCGIKSSECLRDMGAGLVKQLKMVMLRTV